MAIDETRARLTVDLEALAENYRRLVARVPRGAVAGVVKADGYGLGAPEVAGALWQTGCRSFFVAHPDEGLALRSQLPDAVIYVLHGMQTGRGTALVEGDLVPVLNEPGEIERFAALAGRLERRLPAVLQIDTGMCRLGLAAAQIERLDGSWLAALDLRLVMSHLVVAEERAHPLNREQLERFERLRALLPPAPASLANSSGIFLGEAYHFDLCRPGVALYGVNPTPQRPNPMRPVVTLEAPVLQVHDVVEAGSVGYGATFATRPGMRIATVPVGYADGYPRAAGNRATARIGGREVAVVGRVSMDLITLDVTTLSPDPVRPGTPVEMVGGADGVDRLARSAGTIGYEVLTRLGSRFARHYMPPWSGEKGA